MLGDTSVLLGDTSVLLRDTSVLLRDTSVLLRDTRVITGIRIHLKSDARNHSATTYRNLSEQF